MIGAAAPLLAFSRPVAPAVFLATQSGFGVMPDFDLWNLTTDIPGHPTGSSVSSATLLAAGFALPAKDEPAHLAARRHAWHASRRSLNSRSPFAPEDAQ